MVAKETPFMPKCFEYTQHARRNEGLEKIRSFLATSFIIDRRATANRLKILNRRADPAVKESKKVTEQLSP